MNALEAELDRIVLLARSAWPQIALSDEVFAGELAQRLEGSDDLFAALQATHVEDLYLAVACGVGDTAALGSFEETLIPDLRQSLTRMGLNESVVTESLQEVRQALFVPAPGARAKIRSYAGHGALRGWLRAVGGRVALKLARASNDGAPAGPELAAPDDDPELQYMKRAYRGPFEEALREALGALPVPDRLLLKQRCRHGLSLEELAVIYGVHPSTVSRRVTEARERLVDATRDGMMKRLKVSRGEISSILRLIQSEIDLSLSRMSEIVPKVPGA